MILSQLETTKYSRSKVLTHKVALPPDTQNKRTSEGYDSTDDNNQWWYSKIFLNLPDISKFRSIKT